MKIQVISNEKKLIDELMICQNNISEFITLYSGINNSLDILSFIFTDNASLIILDDDYTSPHSVQLLESIRKVKNEQKVIFLTSDDSLQLGKEISSLGVQYYAIKPITGKELIQSINAIIKHNSSVH